MNPSNSWEAVCSKAIRKFPSFYGTQSFITVPTKSRFLSLSWAKMSPLQASPSCLSNVSFNILLPSVPVSSKWTVRVWDLDRTVYTSATYPSHLIISDAIIPIIFTEAYRSWISSFCSFIRSPVSRCFWGLKCYLQHPVLGLPRCMQVAVIWFATPSGIWRS